MPTPAERRALVFLAVVAALGVGARGVLARRDAGGPSDAATAALDRQIGAVDAATSARTSARNSGKAAKGVRGRSAKSPGGDSVAQGRRAPGGAKGATKSGLKPVAPAGGRAASPPDPLALYEARRLAVERSNTEARARVAERTAELMRQRWLGVTPDGAVRGGVSPQKGKTSRSRDRAQPEDTGPVDLDTADAAALMSIPGIGPALAARIVEDRRLRGPFGSLEGLQRVKGIGPGLASRIGGRVTFSRRLSAPPSVTRFTFKRRPALYP